MRRHLMYVVPVILILFSAETGISARTELISRAPDGTVGNGTSKDPSISADARFVVYESTARNLVSDKTTSNRDIFLYDRFSKTTSRISAPPGDEGNSSSFDAEISANGQVVVFTSDASNLVNGDTEGNRDIFVYDRSNSSLARVSIASNGNAANDDCNNPDVSGDGRYVVFESAATNLVNDDTNGLVDIFRHDRTTGTTVRVSRDFLGNEVSDYDCEEPVISNSGRYIAFQTRADLGPCDDNNNVDIYLRDMQAQETIQASVTTWGCCPNSSSYHPSISGDGRYVLFSSNASDLLYYTDDNNSQQDVYLRDFQQEKTERISVSTNGGEGDARSVGYGGNISSNGQYVVFSSPATNFAMDSNGGYDVFARNRNLPETTREGVGTYWEEGSGDSSANVAVISSNGKYVVFDSQSAGIVPDDSNGNWDIFIRDYLWAGPLITSISPKSGSYRGGTLINIVGSNFEPQAAVSIGGKPALNVSVNSAGTVITCISPPHDVGTVTLQVTNPDGSRWVYPIGRGRFNGYIYRTLMLPHLKLLLL